MTSTGTNIRKATVGPRTVWDVLLGDDGGPTTLSGLGGADMPALLARRAPRRLPSGASEAVRRRMATAARAELEGDRLLARFGDMCRQYDELMKAARASVDAPGTPQRCAVSPLTRTFRQVVDVDVVVDEVTVMSTQLSVLIELACPAVLLTLLDGVVVSAGPADLDITATLKVAGSNAFTRSDTVALSRLLAVETDLRLMASAEVPRQADLGLERA